jgi:xanthine dehydrogenase YagS FAD-binding subunit
MHPFSIVPASSASKPNTMVIAGGTDMIQLLRNGVVRPDTLRSLDVATAQHIATDPDGALRLPALATMAQVGAHPLVRAGWPAISDALLAAASPQIRNLGTVGGNLLQRTRCLYFRDTAFPCNKREVGSGCPAIPGRNRELAILGGSDHCIATHPSDMPAALIAFDAAIETDRGRTMKLADFYRLPGDTPWIENDLQPGELITAIVVPASQAARRSTYVKVRDRQSYAYALASVAAGIEIQNGTITDIRLAAGGVGARPWRLPEVEAALRGQSPTPENIRAASALAANGSIGRSENAFKIKLLVNVTRRAIETVSA